MTMPNSVVVEKISIVLCANLQLQFVQNQIRPKSVQKCATILYERCKDLPSTVSLPISSLMDTYTIDFEFSIYPEEMKSATKLFYYQKLSLFSSLENRKESLVESMGCFHSKNSPFTTVYTTLPSRLWNETKVFLEIQILDECNASFFGHSWTVLQNYSPERTGSNFEDSISNSPIMESLSPLKARRSSSLNLQPGADYYFNAECKNFCSVSSNELDDSFIDVCASQSDQKFHNIEESEVDNVGNSPIRNDTKAEAFDCKPCPNSSSPDVPITTDILNQVG